MALGRPKKKDRVQTTVQIDKKHLNRMQGVNRSDVVNVALSEYYDRVDHEERRRSFFYEGGPVPLFR